jgi:hypothetical protein
MYVFDRVLLRGTPPKLPLNLSAEQNLKIELCRCWFSPKFFVFKVNSVRVCIRLIGFAAQDQVDEQLVRQRITRHAGY